ncbi:MAG: hypothetical protein WBM50_13650 [Acidimicrobiales bacterium]
MPFVDFTALTAPTAADLDIVSRQGMMVFATAADRNSQLSGVLAEGMFCFTKDDDSVYYYDGSNWVTYTSPEITYTPTWQNFTPGALSTVAASYQWLPGLRLACWGQVTIGSDGSVDGNVKGVLPLSQSAGASGATGSSLQNDVGTRIYNGFSHCIPGATVFDFHHAESGNGGVVNATNPFTWTTGDVFTWDIQVAVT